MSRQKIHRLPDNLVSRIAAGEVVERPASVLKELLENCLDAGARNIEIHLEGAGRARIRISDDGVGMSPEDARLCLERHATSKIASYDDLENLATFGFRGEALPSIAAVSRFQLTTCERGQVLSKPDLTPFTGWALELEGGKLLSEKPAAREPGTTIEVRDLFFNTPARFKFLKSDATERAQCLRVIEEAVFSASDAGFKIVVDGGKPLVVERVTPDLKDRIGTLWGRRFADVMVPVSAQEPHFSIRGLVSHADGHNATAKNQLLFVNKRPVLNRRLTRAVYDAFVGQLPVGRHPAWVLFLDVNPQAVDVNVHPSKREVKLAFESEIYGFLVNAVRAAIQKSGSALLSTSFETSFQVRHPGGSSNGVFSPFGGMPVESFRESYRTEKTWNPASAGLTAASVRSSIHSLYQPAQGFTPELAPLKNQTFRALAQHANMFIVAEGSDGLVIVDQHAAAEKVLYEKLMAEKKSFSPKTQMLLVPFSWEVAVSLVPQVKAHVPRLQQFGFAIEPFVLTTFLVKGYPSDLGEKFDLLTLLDSLTDVFTEGVKSRHPTNGTQFPKNVECRDLTPFDHKLAAMAACKGSVRAGDPLDLKSCQALLDQLVRLDAPHTCPHGRPTLVNLSKDDLQRRFRRI